MTRRSINEEGENKKYLRITIHNEQETKYQIWRFILTMGDITQEFLNPLSSDTKKENRNNKKLQ